MTFAISATGSDAHRTYQLMKETIKSIIDTRGVISIHYSLIVFGATASTIVNLGNRFTNEKLKELVDSAARQTGTPSLHKALEEAGRHLKGSDARSQAEKILVVIVDNKSGTSLAQVSSAAKRLADGGIRVIPVAIGDEAGRTELRVMGSEAQTVVEATKTEDPRELGKRILDNILEGNFHFIKKINAVLEV